MSFLETSQVDQEQWIILCAYNGFEFDFKVLLHHLKEENIALNPKFLLIDPSFEIAMFTGKFKKFEEVYQKEFN